MSVSKSHIVFGACAWLLASALAHADCTAEQVERARAQWNQAGIVDYEFTVIQLSTFNFTHASRKLSDIFAAQDRGIEGPAAPGTPSPHPARPIWARSAGCGFAHFPRCRLWDPRSSTPCPSKARLRAVGKINQRVRFGHLNRIE